MLKKLAGGIVRILLGAVGVVLILTSLPGINPGPGALVDMFFTGCVLLLIAYDPEAAAIF